MSQRKIKYLLLDKPPQVPGFGAHKQIFVTRVKDGIQRNGQVEAIERTESGYRITFHPKHRDADQQQLCMEISGLGVVAVVENDAVYAARLAATLDTEIASEVANNQTRKKTKLASL